MTMLNGLDRQPDTWIGRMQLTVVHAYEYQATTSHVCQSLIGVWASLGLQLYKSLALFLDYS
jgi:hypothetical protein